MVGEHPQSAPGAPRWKARVASLAAWLTAFLVVTTLLRLFGDQLESLPLELRSLVISGVLVGLMANVVMPALNGRFLRAADETDGG